jgi:hypothetical protein
MNHFRDNPSWFSGHYMVGGFLWHYKGKAKKILKTTKQILNYFVVGISMCQLSNYLFL